MGLYSTVAENLLLGTSLAETQLFYLVQKPKPIAKSLWQIEDVTYKDMLRFVKTKPKIRDAMLAFLNMNSFPESHEFLTGNMYAACMFARLKYYSIPAPLPNNDAESLARYWSKYYQTDNDPSQIARFVTFYETYCT